MRKSDTFKISHLIGLNIAGGAECLYSQFDEIFICEK